MFELGLKILLAYLLGSISGSLLVGRLAGGVDIRTEGSGNAGGTNALRTHGLWFALPVLIIDVGKGALAAGLIPGLEFFAGEPVVGHEWLAVACAAAAVIGHIWPVWYQFRGGKGAGTLIGTFTVLAPQLLLPALGAWLVCFIATGYVGLSTMLAASAAAVVSTLWYLQHPALTLYAFAMAVLVGFAHRSNVARMRAGEENRVERAMFWRRKRR